jgi:hypothetical protein
MSTIEPKPDMRKPLNSRLLTVAAILLIVLALLFMATPLFRTVGVVGNRGNFVSRNGQFNNPNGQFTNPNGSDTQQGFRPFQNGTGRGSTNFPTRRFVPGSGLLAGVAGSFIYFGALIVSVIAALGMFTMKRWGKALGIVMGVLYLLVGLLSLIPLLFLGAFGLRNPVMLILDIVHVLLAISVIVFASIPGKRLPASLDTPSEAATA